MCSKSFILFFAAFEKRHLLEICRHGPGPHGSCLNLALCVGVVHKPILLAFTAEYFIFN